jgi:hypothetical protein
MLARMTTGARIVASTPFARGSKLAGTELLLTAAGRATLTEHYQKGFAAGALAVCSSVDTSQSHLDRAGA